VTPRTRRALGIALVSPPILGAVAAGVAGLWFLLTTAPWPVLAVIGCVVAYLAGSWLLDGETLW
jgi:hypothetical protein